MEVISDVSERYPELKILRVYLEHEAQGQKVIFEIIVRRQLVGRLVLPPRELGLPLTADEANEVNADSFKLPSYIRRGIIEGFGGSGKQAEPIWISLEQPTGFLPMVPWERLLSAHVETPLLRLPHLLLKPYMPRQSLDIAICFGIPVGPESSARLAASVLKAIPLDTGRAVRLYIFANPSLGAKCRELARQLGKTEVTIFDSPAGAPEPEGASAPDDTGADEASAAPELTNPWLTWMLRRLDNRSLDHVQFVSQCSQVEEQGRLEFEPLEGYEQGPATRSSAREIAAFLDRTGAWSVSLISPPTNEVDSGMRMLQDRLACLRPGPICLYDLEDANEAKGLEQANRFILSTRRVSPPVSASLSLVCHPEGAALTSLAGTWLAGHAFGRAVAKFLAWSPLLGVTVSALAREVLTSEAAQKRMSQLLEKYTLVGRLGSELESRRNTPAYIVSAQRDLERLLAQLHNPLVNQSARAGAHEAIELMANWLSEQIKQNQLEKGGGSQKD